MNGGEQMKRKIIFRGKKYETSQVTTAYLLLIPSVFMLLFLFIIPVVQVVIMSFTNYRLTTGVMQFNGITNYLYLFADPKFSKAMINSLIFSGSLLLFDTSIALAIAFLLDSIIPFKRFFRMAFFAPVVVPIVASSLIWLWFYDPGIGPFNQILSWFGVSKLKWLYGQDTAMFSIILFTVWKGVGYNIILFLAGLQNIPESIVEAARVDGANTSQIIRKIKIPMLAPVISFVMMMGIINSFKVFTEINVMTPNGGPLYSTALAVSYIYEQAFTNGRMGRGAAASVLLFIVIFGFTLLQRRLSKKSLEVD